MKTKILIITVATYLITTNLYSQIKPYIAIGVVNDCHEYSWSTGYLEWNGMDIYESGKINSVGTALNVGSVFFDKIIIGYTRSNSYRIGKVGLNHFNSTITASGVSVIPILYKTDKLKLGIGVNISRQKTRALYSDSNHFELGYWGYNLASLSLPIYIDYKISNKISILGMPSWGMRESFAYIALPVWSINLGLVYNLDFANNNENTKKIKTY